MNLSALDAVAPAAEAGLSCFDTQLAGLNVALDPVRLQPILSAALARKAGRETAPVRILGVQLLKHRPRRRCSLAVSVEHGGQRRRLFVKVFRGRRGRRIEGVMKSLRKALERTEATRVPATIHYADGQRMLVTEYVEGAGIAPFLYTLAPEATARRIAVSLADLHTCDARLPRRWTIGDELETTARWIAELPRELSDRAAVLLGRLADRAPAATCGVPIHRDFYPEQLITSGRHCYLLDLDDARTGDPAVDAGNFLAHLKLRAFEQRVRRGACRRAGREFSAIYLERSPGSPTLAARLHFYETTSLLRLAGVYCARDSRQAGLPMALLSAAQSRFEALR